MKEINLPYYRWCIDSFNTKNSKDAPADIIVIANPKDELINNLKIKLPKKQDEISDTGKLNTYSYKEIGDDRIKYLIAIKKL